MKCKHTTNLDFFVFVWKPSFFSNKRHWKNLVFCFILSLKYGPILWHSTGVRRADLPEIDADNEEDFSAGMMTAKLAFGLVFALFCYVCQIRNLWPFNGCVVGKYWFFPLLEKLWCEQDTVTVVMLYKYLFKILFQQ